MGAILSSILRSFRMWPVKKYKILILGLDNAGKTTLLYWLRLHSTIVTAPTVGINVEEVKLPHCGASFVAWDFGGHDKLRILWSRFYEGTKGLVFVVDSSDIKRLDVAHEALRRVLDDPLMETVPVIVMANKQDLPGAIKQEELEKLLKLSSLTMEGHKWSIIPTVATTGKGLLESMEALAILVKKTIENEKNSI
ncbi:hypothetical protein CRM22_004509 [Opisthorchis felineus]|uniref:Uncharacterized protein n=1 Tax=Opisthorchis felineus TaxID=147828 RepID=A0A4S2M257_OPIFE|nr:hypothetical protein CRM22_004509 [Opisthorchis felineus]